MSLFSASPLDSISAAASSKAILFGEHSILYGGSALTLPLKKLGLKIKFTPSTINTLVLKAKDVNASNQIDVENKFWSLLEKDFSDVSFFGHYEIKSEIPLGAGLGSSASLCVALHKLHRPHISKEELIQLAWKSENFFHGKSSGMDPCTIVNEKALFFTSPLQYELLNEDLLQSDNYLFILKDSGVRRSTEKGILESQTLKKTDPEKWKNILLQLQDLALVGRALFENSETTKLGEAMNSAHQLLTTWGLSHPALEICRDELISAGALGAKMTGAGRGGFLISLFERSAWDLLKARQNSRSASSFLEIRL